MPRTPRSIAALLTALVTVLVTAAPVACSRTPPPPPTFPSPVHGKPMPDMPGYTLRGDRFDPGPLAGQVVVVKFFAKYCKPCFHTLPATQSLGEKYDDVAVVYVSLDESAADAAQMVTQFGLTFPVLFDRSRRVAGSYRVVELPMTFVIDKEGVVQWVGGPGQTPEHLRSAVLAYR